MANRVKSTQSVIYELTKESVEKLILSPLSALAGEELPFKPNKISVDYSDPSNGIYQIRLEFDETLPQVMPLREGKIK